MTLFVSGKYRHVLFVPTSGCSTKPWPLAKGGDEEKEAVVSCGDVTRHAIDFLELSFSLLHFSAIRSYAWRRTVLITGFK